MAGEDTVVDVQRTQCANCLHEKATHKGGGCMLCRCRNFIADPPDFTPRPREEGATEAIDHPQHYGGDTTYETIKVIKAWGFLDNALRFNSIKYLSRAGKKGDDDKTVEDLRKAIWYIEKEIEELQS